MLPCCNSMFVPASAKDFTSPAGVLFRISKVSSPAGRKCLRHRLFKNDSRVRRRSISDSRLQHAFAAARTPAPSVLLRFKINARHAPRQKGSAAKSGWSGRRRLRGRSGIHEPQGARLASVRTGVRPIVSTIQTPTPGTKAPPGIALAGQSSEAGKSPVWTLCRQSRCRPNIKRGAFRLRILSASWVAPL
jgi:hypothetical protein